MKIAVITCYDQPDYVRARTLRAGFAAVPGADCLVIRNRHKGLSRYLEVPLKILAVRWRHRPDVYVITFRGYEMLLFMVLTLVRKPIIFDEMVNFTEWMEEHGKIRPGRSGYRLFRLSYAWLARRSRFILADTDAHAAYSAGLNELESQRYRTIPVGTDETVFHPRANHHQAGESFTIFYYGHMLPLHGLSYVLEAAKLLQDRPEISFHIVGGDPEAARACRLAIRDGAHISYDKWLPFETLAETASQASLTLGGPFGGTLQSRFVITGKTYQFLALGVPVLVGRNQVNTVFRDRLNALVVPQADAPALADAINWAWRHPEELHRIGRRGRELYLKRFSQLAINQAVEELVESLNQAQP